MLGLSLCKADVGDLYNPRLLDTISRSDSDLSSIFWSRNSPAGLEQSMLLSVTFRWSLIDCSCSPALWLWLFVMVTKSAKQMPLQNVRNPKQVLTWIADTCKEVKENLCLKGILSDESGETVENFYYKYSRSMWNRFILLFIHKEKNLSPDRHFNLWDSG